MAEVMRTSGLNGHSENAFTRGSHCWTVISRAHSLVMKRSSASAAFLSSEAAPGAKALCQLVHDVYFTWNMAVVRN